MQDTLSKSDEFTAHLLRGLTAKKKSIPSRYFYDARGSALFDHITQQPEYYLTRCETEILENSGSEIAHVLRDVKCVVEFGSGSSTKTEILLRKLKTLAWYVAIDVSPTALAEAERRLSKNFPNLAITTHVANFSDVVQLPKSVAALKKSGFFPGSTIGNFPPEAASRLLQTFSRTLSNSGHMIVGIDLKKSPHIIDLAYNDASGVTADFNLNLLHRANRESGANFDVDAFDHRAAYDPDTGGVDMYLVSTVNQRVNIDGEQVLFSKNETIHTEHSHKYSLEEFEAVCQASGWSMRDVWTDRNDMFAVVDLVSI